MKGSKKGTPVTTSAMKMAVNPAQSYKVVSASPRLGPAGTGNPKRGGPSTRKYK